MHNIGPTWRTSNQRHDPSLTGGVEMGSRRWKLSGWWKQIFPYRLSGEFGNFESAGGGSAGKSVSNVDLLEGLTSGVSPMQPMGGMIPGLQPMGHGLVAMPMPGTSQGLACGIPPGSMMMAMGMGMNMGCLPGQPMQGVTPMQGQPGVAPTVGISPSNVALAMNQNMSMVRFHSLFIYYGDLCSTFSRLLFRRLVVFSFVNTCLIRLQFILV